ncbi:hypothetical protein FALCPG4_19059 [Fusarium falciforme]
MGKRQGPSWWRWAGRWQGVPPGSWLGLVLGQPTGGTDWRLGRGVLALALALALALERLAGERQNQNSRGRKKIDDARLRDTDERSRVAQTQQGGRLSRSWPNGRGLGT